MLQRPLELTMPAANQVRITRQFSAPRPLVWDAYTIPALVRRWLLGPPGWTMPVCDIDLRVGGKYRYVWRDPNGVEMAMGGTYRTIAQPSQIQSTQLFDADWTGGETLETLDLIELEDHTRVEITVVYASEAARDAALRTGMADGMEMSFANLDALLVTMPDS